MDTDSMYIHTLLVLWFAIKLYICTAGNKIIFHNLYSSPNIIRMIMLRRMRWAGLVARIGRRRRMHVVYWWESQKK
jgi:uncharacterized pyridoxamine 5'-phosphate oxidase family protein